MDPDRLLFTKEHEWIALEDGSDIATVGITDFAAGELGDIVFVELPSVGTSIKGTEPVGTIEAVKTVADLFAPVSGVIREINGDLEDNPGVVNRSPFGEGWFFKVQLSDRSEVESLMGYPDYKKMIGKE